MKQWIKRILGSSDGLQVNKELNPVDHYVLVNKGDLDGLLAELQELRGLNLSTEARDLDLLLGNMEAENKALRALIDSYNIASSQVGLK
jgi:hypothetical protein